MGCSRQRRLIQTDSLNKLTQFGELIWWYTLHRFVNTLSLLGLTFALFSGKMMDEKWLPQGELDRAWYYAHLVSWLILFACIALHLLMSLKVGGIPLILSMTHCRFRSKDSPNLWYKHLANWRSKFKPEMFVRWLSSLHLLKVLEILILITIVSAWMISLTK